MTARIALVKEGDRDHPDGDGEQHESDGVAKATAQIVVVTELQRNWTSIPLEGIHGVWLNLTRRLRGRSLRTLTTFPMTMVAIGEARVSPIALAVMAVMAATAVIWIMWGSFAGCSGSCW